MIVAMVTMGMMQMRVMEIIDVSPMVNSDVTTSRAMDVRVVRVVLKVTTRHSYLLPWLMFAHILHGVGNEVENMGICGRMDC
jgi:hypothetical protein